MAAARADKFIQTEDPKRNLSRAERTTFDSPDSGQGTRWIFWMIPNSISKLLITIGGSIRIHSIHLT